MKDKPLVSVCMITYNHEQFIREAIEGVLMQEVDFPIEFLIADDFSPDGTLEIVEQYIRNHPKGNWIRYVRHSQNKGMMGNFVWALESCKGKYIALCEGDDYWIDPFKLKKQIEILESYPTIVLSYHPVKILMPEGTLVNDFITEKNFKSEYSGLYDLALFGNYIHTASVVFRNVIPKYPEYFQKLNVGDFFLYLHLANYGSFAKIPLFGSVYRYGIGIFTGQNHQKMRSSFKQSLLLSSQNHNDFFVRRVLWFRFHQDKLFNNSKTYYLQIGNNKLSLIKNINFLNIAKGLVKVFLRTEKKKIFNA